MSLRLAGLNFAALAFPLFNLPNLPNLPNITAAGFLPSSGLDSLISPTAMSTICLAF